MDNYVGGMNTSLRLTPLHGALLYAATFEHLKEILTCCFCPVFISERIKMIWKTSQSP